MTDWLDLLTSLFGLAAVVAGGIFAVLGLQDWRRQHIGKRRIELAEDGLAKAYEVVDVVKKIREPFVMTGEGSTRARRGHESDEEAQWQEWCYAPYERFQSYKEVYFAFRAFRFRYMAVFGKETQQPFADLDEVLNRVFAASRMLSHLYRNSGSQNYMTEVERQKWQSKKEKHEEIMLGSMEPGDPIYDKLMPIVEKFEAIAKSETSKIKRKHGRAK